MKGTCSHDVIIVVPIYRSELRETERVSLLQLQKVLGNYPRVFLAPASLSFDFGALGRGFGVERFDDAYFDGLSGYSCLMLSDEFYARFADYQYVLIYQLDAFVFQDTLRAFCALGYDYIGAPVGRLDTYWHVLGARVGNGGLSLRKVSACRRMLRSWQDWGGAHHPLTWMFLAFEDVFWGFLGACEEFDFHVPDAETALSFSVQGNVAHAYERIAAGWRPFGCHGWDKLAFAGLKKYVEMESHPFPDFTAEQLAASRKRLWKLHDFRSGVDVCPFFGSLLREDVRAMGLSLLSWLERFPRGSHAWRGKGHVLACLYCACKERFARKGIEAQEILLALEEALHRSCLAGDLDVEETLFVMNELLSFLSMETEGASGVRRAVWYARALALWKKKKYPEAQNLLQEAWQRLGIRTIRGMLLMAYILRDAGQLVSEVQQVRELLAAFEKAPERNLLADAWSILGAALQKLGQNRAAVDAFLQSAEIEPDPAQKLVECSNAIFAADSVEGFTAEEFQKLYARYRELVAGLHPAAYPKPVWHHEKLRIGYLSADIREHAVAQFVWPLLREYDHAAFDVYVYSLVQREDGVTTALHDPAAIWRRATGQSYAEIAAQIRADEIDVLFDLSGHSAENVLPVFAWRPARVQISGIGYFNSTGLDTCDGFLSDVHCAPEERSPYFTERLLRLPQSHFCYMPFAHFPDVTPPPCLTKGFVTFGCFNNFSKVTDGMLTLWRQILSAVPGAHLLLKHALFGSEEGRTYTRRRLQRLGFADELCARIEMRGLSHEYLQEYGDMDIALDTFPYPGGLTTCEALMMGVPVVSLVGSRHGARFGRSFLENIGFGELAVDTKERYAELAIGLAQDVQTLAALRQVLRKKMLQSPIMDGASYVRDVEALFRQLVTEKSR